MVLSSSRISTELIQLMLLFAVERAGTGGHTGHDPPCDRNVQSPQKYLLIYKFPWENTFTCITNWVSPTNVVVNESVLVAHIFTHFGLCVQCVRRRFLLD